MSRRRASSPMDSAASRAADDDFYARHPEMTRNGKREPLDPNNPGHASLRDEWLDAYARHGGKVTPVQAKNIRHAKAQANRNFSDTPLGSAIQECPNKKNKKNQPAVGQRNKSPAKQATSTGQASSHKAPVCELVSAKVLCGHGREAGPGGVLMVVPDSTASLGDSISGSLSMKGGCGQHPAWSVGGMWVSEGKGASFSFNAKTWAASARGFLALKSVSPQTYQVHLAACGGSLAYEIQAYPPGKVGAKLDTNKITDPIRNALKILPVAEEELNKWTRQWFRGSIEYAGAWKEDAKSWKAFYEMSVSGGFDPLIGIAYKGPVYPLTLVPGWLAKWVKAGLFYEIKVGSKLQGAFKGQYWPSESTSNWNEKTVTGGGGGSGALSLELKLASSEVVEGAISGESGLGIEVVGTSSAEPKVELAIKFDGVKGKASLKAAWGWIELTREFQLIKERELYRKEWLLAGD